MGTVGLSVSVTGERYGRQTVGTIAVAANRHTALYINWCTVGTVGFSVSVTGEKYGRQTVGTIAVAAIDIQHYTLTGVLCLLCGLV